LGTTSNDVYLTLATPLQANGEPIAGQNVYHSVVYIGSFAGAGATDEESLIDNVWSHFQSKTVKTVEERDIWRRGRASEPMFYWNNWALENFSVARLLRDRDGRCGAWTRLFVEVLNTQGFELVGAVQLTSANETKPFMVMNGWVSQGQHAAGTDKKIRFHTSATQLGLNQSNSDYALDTTSELTYPNGLPSQGINNRPAGIFSDHVFAFVVYNGAQRWLDPSYGAEYVGANWHAKMTDFETKALYGIASRDLFNPLDRYYLVTRQRDDQLELTWNYYAI
jgi:hypothetical protein